MPQGLISANLLVCEKILNETDNSISVIRIADIVYFQRRPNIPVEGILIMVRAIAITKFDAGDEAEHTAQLRLTRPDGSVKDLDPSNNFNFRESRALSQIPDSPRGFNLIAEIPIIPNQTGTHFLHLLIDGQDVVRFPFTLVEKTVERE